MIRGLNPLSEERKKNLKICLKNWNSLDSKNIQNIPKFIPSVSERIYRIIQDIPQDISKKAQHIMISNHLVDDSMLSALLTTTKFKNLGEMIEQFYRASKYNFMFPKNEDIIHSIYMGEANEIKFDDNKIELLKTNVDRMVDEDEYIYSETPEWLFKNFIQRNFVESYNLTELDKGDDLAYDVVSLLSSSYNPGENRHPSFPSCCIQYTCRIS